MGMNAGYFSDQRKGDLMSRITQDVMVVQYCITNTLQVAFRDPLLIIGYVIYMLLVSWQLSLFAILFLPVVALIIGRIVKKLRHPALKGQERMGDMVSVLDESLSGIKVIKVTTPPTISAANSPSSTPNFSRRCSRWPAVSNWPRR